MINSDSPSPDGWGSDQGSHRPDRLESPRPAGQGAVRSVWPPGVVSRLPISIAERELNLVGRELGWDEENLVAVRVDADGPANVLILAVESEHIAGVFTGFGRRG